MKSRSALFPLLFAPLFFTFLILQDDLVERLRQGLRQYTATLPEKVYVHTDKPYYVAGEVIWFKAYLVDAVLHRPAAGSGLLYVELIDPQGEVREQRNIRIEQGTGAGDILLRPNLPSGHYQLRAYTSHMRNFDEAFLFRRPLTIFSQAAGAIEEGRPAGEGPAEAQAPDSPVELGFYPEGGDLVMGLTSRLAVKALDSTGRAVMVEGDIVDEAGNWVAGFATDERGMALLPFTPKAGRSYSAVVNYEGTTCRTPLPAPLREGYVLKVSNRAAREGRLNITLTASPGRRLEDVVIAAHTRGVLTHLVGPRKGLTGQLTGWLPTDSLPAGVTHITLFSKAGEPLAERLVFLPDRAPVRLSVTSKREQYGIREEVALRLHLRDAQGKTLAGNLSMSVTSQERVDRNPLAGNIQTYLLLNSDVQGHIEDPAYYFEDPFDPKRAYQLDLLLMTQGWRRFVWEEVLDGQPWVLSHPKEPGFTLRGRLKKVDSEAPVQGYVWIDALSDHAPFRLKLLSKKDGTFAFHNAPIRDTTEIILQARLPGKRDLKDGLDPKDMPDNPTGRRQVSIEPIFPVPPPVQTRRPLTRDQYNQNMIAAYLDRSTRIRQIDSAFSGMSVYLDAVEVRARAPRPRDPFDRPGMIYGRPDNRVIVDSVFKDALPINALDLLRYGNVPGVFIYGSFPCPVVTIRGSGAVGFLLDGMWVDAQTISSINPMDIEFIDVLRGPSAAIYGVRGGAGVIAFYTRIGRSGAQHATRAPGIANFTHPGYYKAREFYAPAYDGPPDAEQRPDYRSPLHWAPRVPIAADGETEVSFFTSDETGAYHVQVEGMTADGRPVVGTYSFRVGND